MMYEKIGLNGAAMLLRSFFAALPHGLWDRYLWVYNRLESWLHNAMFGMQEPYGPLETGILSERGVPCALLIMGDGMEDNRGTRKGTQIMVPVFPGSHDLLAISRILHSALKIPGGPVELSSNVKNVCDALAAGQSGEYASNIRLYADQSGALFDTVAGCVREMTPADEPLLDRLPQRVWPGYREMIGQGIRFFGCIRGDRLVSMAGLCPMTALRAELIGVETFLEADRSKGCAAAVCSLALGEGLINYPYITWSTSQENKASVALARKIGLKLICEKHICRVESWI